MSENVCKVLFLTVPDEEAGESADVLGHRIADHLPDGRAVHEFMELRPGEYDAVLDRLDAGVLPVVLKPARRQGGR
jgi:hypothetical protein